MSFVTTLATDSKTIDAPTWDDVERAVRALDGSTETLVTLAPHQGEHHLAIGGGRGGQFIVYLTEDNLTFFNLAEPAAHDDRTPVRMLIGGQEGEYRKGQFVSLDVVLRAARHYVQEGGRAPGLTWVEQR